MEFMRSAWDAVRPHLAGLGLLATWIGIAVVYLRRRADWQRKRFAGHVNFSLNYVADNKLMLRTLLESTTSQVWLNEYGVRLVQAAAAKTRPDQPFILLKDPADMKFVQRAALNVLSERFSEAFLGHAMGQAVPKATFLFAVTFENYPDMRTRKFRILLVEEKSLVALFGPNAAPPDLVDPLHQDRLNVLRIMARVATQPKPDVNGVEVLHRVELGLGR